MAGKAKFSKNMKTGLQQKIKAQISEQISQKMNTRLGKKVSARLNESAETLVQTAHVAAETAKHGIDQVLIGLEHRGINLKESQDLAQKVGRKVLERAEAIRSQLAGTPFSPSWLKDVSLAPKAAAPSAQAAVDTQTTEVTDTTEATDATAAGSMTETSVSVAAEGMQPKQMKDVLREDELATPAPAKPRKGAGKTSSSGSRASK